MAAEITLNGKPEPIAEDATVAGLLDAKGVSPQRVVVELNRRILAREEFATTRLNAGDEVEVVTFVGGG